MVGKSRKKCQRCHQRLVRVPHHLTYKTLGRETKKDVVGVCFPCNDLCHFYEDGRKVPLTEEALRARWKEINSFWYKFKRFRPSLAISQVIHWYTH